MDFKQRLRAHQNRIEEALSEYFSPSESQSNLVDAMNYSLMAGGKRIRPVLLLEVCRMCGGDVEMGLPFACAVEMIHTYSLIHDDLPCMDDDDLRRGKPTNHKVYGEAMAVLAGDGLLTASFSAMTNHNTTLGAERVLSVITCLSKRAGITGMVGGQAMDMSFEGRAVTRSELEEMQLRKTGALLVAAAEIGCIVAGGTDSQRQAVGRYAAKLGLAFQIQDDILDVAGDQVLLGKPVGSDQDNDKSTFVSLLGVQACEELVKKLTHEAVESLAGFQDSEFLTQLALSLAEREK